MYDMVPLLGLGLGIRLFGELAGFNNDDRDGGWSNKKEEDNLTRKRYSNHPYEKKQIPNNTFCTSPTEECELLWSKKLSSVFGFAILVA
jgi:hypothetical protein